MGQPFRVQRIVQPDECFESAYRLLRQHFEPADLDPIDRLREWLELTARGEHSFPFVMMVGYLPVGTQAHLAGVIAGNVMALGTTQQQISRATSLPSDIR